MASNPGPGPFQHGVRSVITGRAGAGIGVSVDKSSEDGADGAEVEAMNSTDGGVLVA